MCYLIFKPCKHYMLLNYMMQTWSNLGDVLVQKAEALSTTGQTSTAAANLFASAAQAYAYACSLSSSEDGDDLPGLLLNWGAGLITAAEYLPDQAPTLLHEAAQRLRESISFNRGDIAPFNALGEVYVSLAERQLKAGEFNAAIQSASLALSDGYRGALQINANTIDAFVGSAEAEAVAAKAYIAGGDMTQAAVHWDKAVEYYTKALPSLTGWIKERSDVKYNVACCLVGCGKKGDGMGVLRELVDMGTVSLEEIRGDPDLAAIHNML
jgi:tetratricopeptide (TPR) repeat protein